MRRVVALTRINNIVWLPTTVEIDPPLLAEKIARFFLENDSEIVDECVSEITGEIRELEERVEELSELENKPKVEVFEASDGRSIGKVVSGEHRGLIVLFNEYVPLGYVVLENYRVLTNRRKGTKFIVAEKWIRANDAETKIKQLMFFREQLRELREKLRKILELKEAFSKNNFTNKNPLR